MAETKTYSMLCAKKLLDGSSSSEESISDFVAAMIHLGVEQSLLETMLILYNLELNSVSNVKGVRTCEMLHEKYSLGNMCFACSCCDTYKNANIENEKHFLTDILSLPYSHTYLNSDRKGYAAAMNRLVSYSSIALGNGDEEYDCLYQSIFTIISSLASSREHDKSEPLCKYIPLPEMCRAWGFANSQYCNLSGDSGNVFVNAAVNNLLNYMWQAAEKQSVGAAAPIENRVRAFLGEPVAAPAVTEADTPDVKIPETGESEQSKKDIPEDTRLPLSCGLVSEIDGNWLKTNGFEPIDEGFIPELMFNCIKSRNIIVEAFKDKDSGISKFMVTVQGFSRMLHEILDTDTITCIKAFFEKKMWGAVFSSNVLALASLLRDIGISLNCDVFALDNSYSPEYLSISGIAYPDGIPSSASNDVSYLKALSYSYHYNTATDDCIRFDECRQPFFSKRVSSMEGQSELRVNITCSVDASQWKAFLHDSLEVFMLDGFFEKMHACVSFTSESSLIFLMPSGKYRASHTYAVRKLPLIFRRNTGLDCGLVISGEDNRALDAHEESSVT